MNLSNRDTTLVIVLHYIKLKYLIYVRVVNDEKSIACCDDHLILQYAEFTLYLYTRFFL